MFATFRATGDGAGLVEVEKSDAQCSQGHLYQRNACERCRRRKLRCNGDGNRCNRCVASRSLCQYQSGTRVQNNTPRQIPISGLSESAQLCLEVIPPGESLSNDDRSTTLSSPMSQPQRPDSSVSSSFSTEFFGTGIPVEPYYTLGSWQGDFHFDDDIINSELLGILVDRDDPHLCFGTSAMRVVNAKSRPGESSDGASRYGTELKCAQVSSQTPRASPPSDGTHVGAPVSDKEAPDLSAGAQSRGDVSEHGGSPRNLAYGKHGADTSQHTSPAQTVDTSSNVILSTETDDENEKDIAASRASQHDCISSALALLERTLAIRHRESSISSRFNSLCQLKRCGISLVDLIKCARCTTPHPHATLLALICEKLIAAFFGVTFGVAVIDQVPRDLREVYGIETSDELMLVFNALAERHLGFLRNAVCELQSLLLAREQQAACAILIDVEKQVLSIQDLLRPRLDAESS